MLAERTIIVGCDEPARIAGVPFFVDRDWEASDHPFSRRAPEEIVDVTSATVTATTLPQRLGGGDVVGRERSRDDENCHRRPSGPGFSHDSSSTEERATRWPSVSP
jgi:hypothetical protein